MNAWERGLESYSAILITGGSSGIGFSFLTMLRRIAGDRLICNLSRTRPHDFADTALLRHFACDMTDRQALAEVVPRIEQCLRNDGGSGQVLIINNSGTGAYGVFPEPSINAIEGVMALNMDAPVALTAALLPLVRERGGAIVNIASTAAFQPTPYLGVYGATKAFLLHWSLALNAELKGSRVRVLAVCPGPTRTGFFRAAGLADSSVRGSVQDPDAVAAESLRALALGRSLVVTGWPNKIGAVLAGLVPKRMVASIAAVVLKSYRRQPDRG